MSSERLSPHELLRCDGVPAGLRARVLQAGNGRVLRLHLPAARRWHPDVASVVLKHVPDDAAGDHVFWPIAEHDFYVELADDCGVRVPRLYAAERAGTGHGYRLLLEDLAPGGNVHGFLDCTLPEAEQAVEALARLHARAWGKTTDAAYAAIPRHDAASLEAMLSEVRRLRPAFLARVAAAAGDALARALSALLDEFDCGHEPRWQTPETLTHGDFHRGNLIFADDGVAVLDWQAIRVHRGGVDLAFFLCSSLSSAGRRRFERRLLAHYQRALLEQGVGPLELAALMQDYARGLRCCLARAVYVIGSRRLDPAVEAGYCTHGLPRLAAALRDSVRADGG
ncbi:MAG: phosphotransferase [Myxococcales bacterium]|nr:phosphotransferase [Myxococcales bacterium]